MVATVQTLQPTYLGILQMFQNVFHESALWLAISCWIVLCGGNKNLLDFHIVCNDGMPLATGISQSCHHSRVGELHSDLLGEERSTVSIEGEHGAIHFLILCPRIHHCGVIHTVHNDIRHALGFQFSLLGKVARHLLCRSGGSECTGKTHHHHFLSPDDLGEWHLLWWEALVQDDVWKLGALGNG